MATYAQARKGKRRSGKAKRRASIGAERFGRERYRFTLHREQRRLTTLNLDPYVEHADWQRDSAIRTGEINFHRPLTGMQARAIAKGDSIRCEVDLHATGRFTPLWQMVVDTPEHQIVAGLFSLALKAELKAAQESKMAWKFRDKDARQITLEAAHRLHLKVGPLPVARHKIDKLIRKSASLVDVVTFAWSQERKASGRRFDVDLSRGRVDVKELWEPPTILTLGPLTIDATLNQALRQMTSAVVVTSTRKEDGRTHKLRVKVVDHARVRRYGYIVGQLDKPRLHTVAACRRAGREYLSRSARPTSELTITHPLLPFLDRGDPVRITLKDADLDSVLCWVKSMGADLSAGSATMDLVLAFADPWKDERKERAKAKRAAAARARKRGGKPEPAKPHVPAKATRRR